MKLVTTRPPDDEMETPWVGSPMAGVFFLVIPIEFFGLAVWNLVRFREIPLLTMSASVIWILFTVWYIATWISSDGGFQRWAIAQLGCFGSKHFAWIDRIDGEPPQISIGFRMWGRRFFYDSFPAVELREVRWNSGRVTAMEGRDMNDWSVTIRFHWTEPPSKWWSHGCRGQCGFGFQGEKARVEAFGESLVAFLRRTGVEFEASADGCCYQVIRPPAEESPTKEGLS